MSYPSWVPNWPKQAKRGETKEWWGRSYGGAPSKNLADDERRALQLLAFNPDGATMAALVLGHGFELQMLDDLVRARLAKRYCVTVAAGGRTTLSVVYMKIMAAGRNTLAE